MPYRPEAELKRPDLKGEFLCGHCGKTFCHAASLNRHRLNFHGDDQQCLVCNTKIPHNDTIRRHMLTEHDIQRVFTCGCCNWTFPDKKELHSHNNSMLKTGTPGEAKVIAVSSRRPGSLSQHELRGEERSPRIKKRTQKSENEMPTNKPFVASPDDLLTLLSSLLSAQQQQTQQEQQETTTTAPAIPASWINQLLAVNPVLLPLFPVASTSTSSASSHSPTASEVEVTKTPDLSSFNSVLPAMTNNNEGETSTSQSDEVPRAADEENVNMADNEKELLMKAVGAKFLSVSTEKGEGNSVSSGPESGIGSAQVSNTPSPVFVPSSSPSERPSTPVADIVTEIVQSTKRANKRRSIDEICFKLVSKKSCL